MVELNETEYQDLEIVTKFMGWELHWDKGSTVRPDCYMVSIGYEFFPAKWVLRDLDKVAKINKKVLNDLGEYEMSGQVYDSWLLCVTGNELSVRAHVETLAGIIKGVEGYEQA